MCSPTDKAASLIEQVSDRITSKIEVFESHDHSVLEKEMHDFLRLLCTHTKSVVYLYRRDLDLLPSANSIARTIIEIAVKVLWLLKPSDSTDSIERLGRLIQSEHEEYKKFMKGLEKANQDGRVSQKENRLIESFRNDDNDYKMILAHLKQTGINGIGKPPTMEEMRKDIPEFSGLYPTFNRYCIASHGNHGATWIYKREKRIDKYDWKDTMYLCIWMLLNTASSVFEKFGGDPKQVLSEGIDEEDIKNLLSKLNSV